MGLGEPDGAGYTTVMVTSHRPFVAGLLSLLIAVTAVHVGVMRGQAKAVGSIVLCTGTGPVGVAVDAAGQPVAPVHVCPDCVISVLAAVDAPATVPHRAAARRLFFVPKPVSARSRAGARQRARGPPHLS